MLYIYPYVNKDIMDTYIDATYVINLDTDAQRLDEFHSMMYNWPYIRHPAINGKKLSVLQPENLIVNETSDPSDILLSYGNILKNRYVKSLSWLSSSEIGCLLSHVSLWEKVATDPHLHRIIIFEDDARTHTESTTIRKLIADFYRYLENNNIPEPDMLYLGKSLDYCINYEKVWGNIYKSTHPLCLHAYIMTKPGAQKLLAMAPYSEAIDMIPIKAIEKKIINVMTFHPSLYFQDIFGLSNGGHVAGTNSNLRKLTSAMNNTTECIVPQQHITGDTWHYTIIITIGLLAALVLFIFFLWSNH